MNEATDVDRLPGVGPDWTTPQDWHRYAPDEHALWDELFARQAAMLQGRASRAFLKGIDVLRMDEPGIPDFDRLSDRLAKLTGWRVVAVPGLVPDDVFYRHLANRSFVAGRFIRTRAQIDYLEEPDVFHDVFGHVPLLSDPAFADYMQAYGEGGLRSMGFNSIHRIARLYWYTVEFGLVREDDDLRLYGAGIVSSFGESRFALEDPSPHRLVFDLRRVMRTRYRIDDYQQTYFVIDSYEALLRATLDTDFAPLYAAMAREDDIAPDALIAGDRIHARGTQGRPYRSSAADAPREALP